MLNNILLTQQKHTSFCNNKKYFIYLFFSVASIIIQSPCSYKYPQVTEDNIYTTIILIFCCYNWGWRYDTGGEGWEDDEGPRTKTKNVILFTEQPSIVIIIITINNIFHNPGWRVERSWVGETNQLSIFHFISFIPAIYLWYSSQRF